MRVNAFVFVFIRQAFGIWKPARSLKHIVCVSCACFCSCVCVWGYVVMCEWMC